MGWVFLKEVVGNMVRDTMLDKALSLERDKARLLFLRESLSYTLSVAISRAGVKFWLDDVWVYKNYLMKIEISMLENVLGLGDNGSSVLYIGVRKSWGI